MSAAAACGLIYVVGMMFAACLLSFLARASKSLDAKLAKDVDRSSFICTGAILWPIMLPAQIGKMIGLAFKNKLP